MRFGWDPRKERQNVAKHSVVEGRFIAVGPIRRALVLVVFTERSEDTIRIISARWASKTERALYDEYLEKDK